MIDMFTPLLVFFVLALFIAILWAVAKQITGPSPSSERDWRRSDRSSAPAYDFLDTDLRLTYKRFKELYPFSRITYKEYKELQAKKAYKRAISSQKIRRMVR